MEVVRMGIVFFEDLVVKVDVLLSGRKSSFA